MEHDICLLVVGDGHDAVDRLLMLLHAVESADALADVPVGGVQNPHLQAIKGVDVRIVDLLAPGCPRREREVDHHRDRDGRL